MPDNDRKSKKPGKRDTEKSTSRSKPKSRSAGKTRKTGRDGDIRLLLSNQASFQALLDLLPQSIFVKDTGSIYVYGNSSFLHDIDLSRERLVGRDDFEIFPRAMSKKFRADDKKVMKSGQVEQIEKRSVRGGIGIIAHTVKAPITDARGQVVGVLGAYWNITDRSYIEDTLRRKEERFRAIADYAYDWEDWLDSEGQATWINPAVKRITGYSVEECLAMPDYPLGLVCPDDKKKMTLAHKSARQGSSGNDLEYRLLCKDGSTVWAAMSWQPIYDARGQSLGYRTSNRNITKRKRAEQSLREAHDELEIRVSKRTAQLTELNRELELERISLQQKNAALVEIMEQIEKGKEHIAYQIQSNLEKVALPILRSLENRAGPSAETYISLLRGCLLDITSPFINTLERQFSRLTPRELEICNMITSGLKTKEIADTLNSSVQTVLTQRKRIRKKLGISGDKINLVSFLSAMKRS